MEQTADPLSFLVFKSQEGANHTPPQPGAQQLPQAGYQQQDNQDDVQPPACQQFVAKETKPAGKPAISKAAPEQLGLPVQMGVECHAGHILTPAAGSAGMPCEAAQRHGVLSRHHSRAPQ
jgi:hypothetical protein